jgi:TonB family protein
MKALLTLLFMLACCSSYAQTATTVTTKTTVTEGEDAPYAFAEQMPQFPGGEDKLMEYFAQNCHYPEAEKLKKITGVVYVNFVVDAKGKVKDARVAKGVTPGMDAEALRVISTMPNWEPGMQAGKPVPVQLTLPLEFMLP